MIKKISFVCTIAGAMVSFGLSAANSAPVMEKTNLAAMLKDKKHDKLKNQQRSAAVASNSNKSTAKYDKKTSTQARGKTAQAQKSAQTMPLIERRSARTKIDLNQQMAGKAQAANQTAKVPSQKTAGKPYSGLIARYAASYGVPLSLAHAVVRQESNYRPEVRGSAGEIGLMQIKLSTARGMGYTGSAKALYDPATNVQFGMKYLGMAHKLGGGTTCGTILKYNAGHGAKRMNPVSARYCNNVKTFMASLG